MKAIKYKPATLYKGMVMTGYGDCYLESRYEESVDAVIYSLNEHDPLLVQRDALVAACEALVEAEDFDDSELLRRAVEYARTALALVKGDQKSDDATT